MQYDLKKLNKQYKQKPITECIDLAKKWNEELIQSGEKLVGLLWYLEKSKKFREYDGYDKLSFRDFVWEVVHISYNRYRELAYAYNWYPQESRELGPQTIQAIRSKVGVTKIPQVLSEIKAAVAELKEPAKIRQTITGILDKHSPPKPKKKGGENTAAHWRHKYEKLYADYQSLLAENKELHAQIERQKGPIAAFLKIQDQVAGYKNVAAQ